MTFKNKEDLANSLKIVCLKKDFGLKKIYKGMEHAKSSVRGTHDHGYAVLNAYLYHFYKAAKVYDRCEFNYHFNQIRDLVPKAAEIGFKKCIKAFCLGNRYNIMTSNIAESVNVMFDVEKEFPIREKFLLHMLIQANLKEGDIRDGAELVNHFQQEKISVSYGRTLTTKELHAQIEMLHKYC
ncbi:hypothetical protein H5410_056997 [Solanum commersonii]|uniref:Uncharacterized protein n=1 Tax=Solanum commersonii TaxID=4109 RepID=A0A9J5WNV3_SOLCO|nr:hypothetical protein H5410_056997 [Solanum commersonii]